MKKRIAFLMVLFLVGCSKDTSIKDEAETKINEDCLQNAHGAMPNLAKEDVPALCNCVGNVVATHNGSSNFAAYTLCKNAKKSNLNLEESSAFSMSEKPAECSALKLPEGADKEAATKELLGCIASNMKSDVPSASQNSEPNNKETNTPKTNGAATQNPSSAQVKPVVSGDNKAAPSAGSGVKPSTPITSASSSKAGSGNVPMTEDVSYRAVLEICAKPTNGYGKARCDCMKDAAAKGVTYSDAVKTYCYGKK